MKTLIMLFVLSLSYCLLIAEVDTLYTEYGYGSFCLTTFPFNFVRVANSSPHMGDTGVGLVGLISPNNTSRGFITFDIGNTEEYTVIDSVKLRLFIEISIGNDISYHLPIWNVVNGDTIRLSIDLVDYGNELDVGDWTAGDIGDSQTILHRCHYVNFNNNLIVPLTTFSDVTLAYNISVALNRDIVQFRFKYDIDTDNDDQFDYTDFPVGSNPVWSPALLVYWRDSVYVAEENIAPTDKLIMSIVPNPARNDLKFSVESTKGSIINSIEIFDIRGRKVSVIELDEKGTAVWNRKDSKGGIVSSGVYLCRAAGDNGTKVVKRVVLIN